MSKAIHTQFVEIAREVSVELTEAIASTEPLELNPSRDVPFSVRLCRAVAGQQLSVRAASTIWGRVMDKASGQTASEQAASGQSLSEQAVSEHALMDYFATVAPETLRSCGLSAAKAKAMGAIASATIAGQLDEQALRELDHAERARCLTQIWGVGQWTADMMGIFYFGDPDIWPEGDTTARKNLERLTSRRRKTLRTAARFAPHRSYLALYMWRQADAGPI